MFQELGECIKITDQSIVANPNIEANKNAQIKYDNAEKGVNINERLVQSVLGFMFLQIKTPNQYAEVGIEVSTYKNPWLSKSSRGFMDTVYVNKGKGVIIIAEYKQGWSAQEAIDQIL
jgi:hypothetical protein